MQVGIKQPALKETLTDMMGIYSLEYYEWFGTHHSTDVLVLTASGCPELCPVSIDATHLHLDEGGADTTTGSDQVTSTNDLYSEGDGCGLRMSGGVHGVKARLKHTVWHEDVATPSILLESPMVEVHLLVCVCVKGAGH